MKKYLLIIICSICALTAQAQEGVLKGLFTVAPGKQVQFSQGNLQFQGRTSTYYFANTQHEVISVAVMSANRNKWQDLFEWTESGWSDQPIVNGGNVAGLWRALTADEWIYLFADRPHANRLRGQATVNNIRGYILLPDNWQMPRRASFIADPNDWNQNVYSVAQWNVLEANGAVFLPAAGFQSGNRIEAFNSYGFYWSSTPYTGANDEAGDFYFNMQGAGSDDHQKKAFGFSVRLVKDRNATASEASPSVSSITETDEPETTQPATTTTQTQPATQTTQTQPATTTQPASQTTGNAEDFSTVLNGL